MLESILKDALLNRVKLPEGGVYAQFDVRPVINCCGIYTDLGGSVLSPLIWKAITELNQSYVRMTELLDSAGRITAGLVGAEAARITPGASAAIALAVAATMTGTDGTWWEQLPDTTGMPSEVVIPSWHLSNYKYATCVRLPGAKIIPASPKTDGGFGPAITANTACVFVAAHLLAPGREMEQLGEFVAAAHAAGVPLVLDAAYMVDPPDLPRQYLNAGADLICVSAKYFGGPNPGGFVAGRASLIEAVEGLDFTRFESGSFRSFGRPFKMSRYDVAATALALEEWMSCDHSARWRSYRSRVDHILAQLPAVAGVSAFPRLFTMSEELLESDRVNCVALEFAEDALSLKDHIVAELERNDHIIATISDGSRLIVAVDALLDWQTTIVGDALRNAISSH